MKRIFLGITALAAASAFGQGLRPALHVSAIVGATVQVSPTKVLKNATVIIRGSVISEVGVGLAAPAGADVIDGKGLTVYYGFIDALTTKGLATPGELPRQETSPDISQDIVSEMRDGTATNHANVLGADLFDPDNAAWGQERSAGFTTALVSPAAGVVVGQPSLLELSGKPRRAATVVPTVGFGFKFQGGAGFGFSRGYPGTPLGMYAVARQAIFDADHFLAEKRAAKAGNPHWPTNDPALEALSNPYPFLMQGNTMPEIDRVLDFGAEFSRKTVLVGGAEAYKLADKVKNSAKAVILTMNFGTEPLPAAAGGAMEELPIIEAAQSGSVANAELEAMAGGQAPQAPGQGQAQRPRPGQGQGQGQGQGPGQGGGRRRGAQNDPNEPPEKKRERQAQWLEKVKNAMVLEKAGIAFALSSEGLGSPDELLTNLRRAVKEGLTKPTALAALTTTPASFFGLSKSFGTVETGKVANLTILSSDLFESGARVKLLFIDGEKIDPTKTPFRAPQLPNFFEEVE